MNKLFTDEELLKYIKEESERTKQRVKELFTRIMILLPPMVKWQ